MVQLCAQPYGQFCQVGPIELISVAFEHAHMCVCVCLQELNWIEPVGGGPVIYCMCSLHQFLLCSALSLVGISARSLWVRRQSPFLFLFFVVFWTCAAAQHRIVCSCMFSFDTLSSYCSLQSPSSTSNRVCLDELSWVACAGAGTVMHCVYLLLASFLSVFKFALMGRGVRE